ATAAILAIGDELLNGQQVDTNSSWISGRLTDLGFDVRGFSILGDDELAIAARLIELGAQVDLVVVTGGLGPTLDDLTRHAIARATERDLVLNGSIVEGIRKLFASRQIEMSAANERQGLFPTSAEIIPNNAGTAPGFRLQQKSGSWIASFPGPPRELQMMFIEEFEPWIGAAFPSEIQTRVANFNLFGIPESEFADRVGDWMSRDVEPRIGVCASGRVLKVRIEGSGSASDGSGLKFSERVAAFRERFGQAIFSEDDPSTAVALGKLLLREQLTFASAESCTGGQIAARLIALPGISEVFQEGFVTYSNDAKRARLQVSSDLLEAHGAVSPEVAGAMASGAAKAAGVRLALSTSGIAGPGGGSVERPVGLVYVGICLDGQVTTHKLQFPAKGRDLICDWATTSACELARRAVLEFLPADR
ncbi:MAG: nicotinamide-nucleotide amidase, partial [Planctomycetota bacterium]